MFAIPEDRDSQNDAVNGQLEVFKGQLMLLDAACEDEESKAARGMPSLLDVCETLYCTLKPTSWKIIDYVRSYAMTLHFHIECCAIACMCMQSLPAVSYI